MVALDFSGTIWGEAGLDLLVDLVRVYQGDTGCFECKADEVMYDLALRDCGLDPQDFKSYIANSSGELEEVIRNYFF